MSLKLSGSFFIDSWIGELDLRVGLEKRLTVSREVECKRSPRGVESSSSITYVDSDSIFCRESDPEMYLGPFWEPPEHPTRCVSFRSYLAPERAVPQILKVAGRHPGKYIVSRDSISKPASRRRLGMSRSRWQPPAKRRQTGFSRRCQRRIDSSGAAPCSQKRTSPPGLRTRRISARAAGTSGIVHKE